MLLRYKRLLAIAMKILAVHPSALLYTKIFLRLEPLGIELIAEGAVSQGEGRGVRLRKSVGARRERTETEERAESASPKREEG